MKRNFGRVLVALATFAFAHATARSAEPDVIKDIEYAAVDGHSLKLDLYAPTVPSPEVPRPPLIVWVHGGAWRAGSKSDVPHARFTSLGFGVASVDYRLSPVAKFPAQVHDIKGAIRYLRAKAELYGYDPAKIVIAGSSAGGHLAALVGVSNGVKELEGTVGGNAESKSDVQAIVSYYGASNLMTILAQSKPRGLQMRPPALQLLLGGQPVEVPELAKLASPVEHVDAKDPPLLLIHGAADPQMPPEQSTELAEAYRKHKRPVLLELIPGAVHGGPQFFDEKRLAILEEFLKESVR
jgi:acetyl esterase/lipase